MASTDSTSNSGIYIIKNAVNGKFYIGQASDLRRRWRDHKKTLRGNRHFNSYLQRAWNKHGEQSFKFMVLEYCSVDQLDEREQHFINLYVKQEDCYNLALHVGNGMRGRKASAETRRKQREAKLGKKRGPMSEEAKRKSSESQKGKIVSDATKEKLRLANLGKTQSPETRAKIALKCSNPSEETRRKISEANKGRKVSEETRRKIGAANSNPSEETRQKLSTAMSGENHPFYGKPRTEEEKRKISEGMKLYRAQKRNEEE